ncbi:MAG: hypothetical protein CMP59_01340 [Flavobacteriales bacterium]|nr:hypothetical protein [Flavobacteriales bacterium]
MILGFTSLNAQNLELSGLYGYQFGSRINYYGGYVKIKDGSGYNASLGYNTGSNYIFQLNYYRNTADVKLRDAVVSPFETRIAFINADWFSIGGTRTTGDGPAYGFFGAALGVLVTTPTDFNLDVLDRELSSKQNFYFEFKGGGTYMFSDYIGFRAQAILQCPIDYAGFYVSAGSGGTSSGVSLNSTVVFFSLQGGLVFTLPQ